MTTRQSRAVTLATPDDLSTLQTWTDSSFVNGRAYVTDFDAATSTVTSTSAEGRVTTAVIDSVGRVLTQVVPGIDTVFFGYDSIGRVETVSQGGDTWSYAYDASGRLQSLTDPLSRTDSLLYDSADRLVRQVLADSLEITYDYDEAGNLTSLTPPGRSAHTFTYNALGLDSIYNPPDVTGLAEDRTFYTYNLDHQLTEVLRPDARSIALAYDAAGRIDSLTIDRGTLDVAYDAVTGQISSVTAPGSEGLSFAYDGFLPTAETWSGTVSGTVALGYDTDFRIDGVAVNGDTIAYGYDDDGYLIQAGELLLERDSLNGRLTLTTLDSVTTRRSFDTTGELATDSAWIGSTLLFARTYERDDLGRITEVVDYADGATTIWGYGYDPFGRLETVTQDSTAYASYAYDANGNRITRTSGAGTEIGTYDAQDRMSTYDGASYSYTAAGELAEKVEGADTTRYGYDELGNLTDVELPDGTLIEYVIDGRNRRIGRKVDGNFEQAFLYGDQLNPVAELDSLGNVVSRFVYGSRPNVPDYVVQGTDTLRVISDHLGSVRLVVNAATGSVAQKISYDEWGRVLADSNPGVQPFGFAGGIWDAATGLVRLGARDYSPVEGRWTAKDPLGFEGGDTQLYSYAFSDPVGWVDVNGQNPALVAAAWGAAWGAAGGVGLSVAMQMALNGCVDWGQVATDAAIGGLGGALIGALWREREVARLLADATQWYRRGPLTRAGRALTKHPNVIGESGNIVQKLGVANVNRRAAAAIEHILRSGTRTVRETKAFGRVIEFKLPSGIGARFGAATRRFIGFLGRGL